MLCSDGLVKKFLMSLNNVFVAVNAENPKGRNKQAELGGVWIRSLLIREVLLTHCLSFCRWKATIWPGAGS